MSTKIKIKYKKKELWLGFWLIVPALLAIFITAFFPLLKTFWDSFFSFGLRPGIPKEFIGFDNYIRLLNDTRFMTSLTNTLIFTGISVSLEFMLGLITALILNADFALRGLVRAAILIPWAIPTSVSSQMWKWMYNDQYGIISQILYNLGWLAPGTPILSGKWPSMFAILAVDVWKTAPFMALLLLAGLQTIPSELYEAARIDGASGWKQFTKITLPILKPTIAVALIFRTLDALRVFDIFYIMNKSVETLAVYNRHILMDRAFTGAWFGYGSAISVVIFLLISIFAIIYIRSLNLKFD
ncbi:carbohydrate ABC transporter membrane protein 1, CUT1 family [Marinitoga hydrogenitolerans DSM 16785]|uniref:Carbohydrate ABC transporter membrane protein 1, CUT1 family n=1 Tax=Marinitoga hydrogenitolerans (strain DSM 16785 / JCM 12826 / AT1271) TaxID=1122195 RepID=A0A1M4UIA5_MARH1|nr:sugar ABC transporter permease [Marinitoga hydrogenitolerans]SHE56388.1 carbohydrate ABC transporter membrane protein 1, CUT1 family [Marinitoga hydrogenitolerans DSM 16785]